MYTQEQATAERKAEHFGKEKKEKTRPAPYKVPSNKPSKAVEFLECVCTYIVSVAFKMEITAFSCLCDPETLKLAEYNA